MQRLEGYRRCLRECGVYDPALEWLDPERSSIALGGELFEAAAGPRTPDVDAIFFCNDDLGQGGLLAALRLGMCRCRTASRSPASTTSTGSDQMLPPLTTVRTPRAQIGAQAAPMLLGLMRRGARAGRTALNVGYELVVRGST